MASDHMASCPCGYRTEVTIGGWMLNFTTFGLFPYYCKECGLVEVNVKAEKIVCPKCNSADIDQYGLENASDLHLEQSDPFPRIQNFNHEAFQDGHKCPQCKNFTLSFGPAIRFID